MMNSSPREGKNHSLKHKYVTIHLDTYMKHAPLIDVLMYANHHQNGSTKDLGILF